MPRVPYVREHEREDLADLVGQIKARRPGGNLIALDRMLLNSPAFARGWNALLGAVRKDLYLSLKHREMLMCAVAILTDAQYQWNQHVPPWLAAGASPEQVEALGKGLDWALRSEAFGREERALLRLGEEMTTIVKVSEETFSDLREHFSNEQIVEAVGVVAAYNMVARFLVALEVE